MNTRGFAAHENRLRRKKFRALTRSRQLRRLLKHSIYNMTTFNQNWHHLYCTHDLPEETIFLMIYCMHENAKKISEKLGAKFPFTTCTLGHSMVRSSCLDDAFSTIFELETIPVEGLQMQQRDKKRRKRVGKKTLKNLDVAYFPSKFGFEHLW